MPETDCYGGVKPRNWPSTGWYLGVTAEGWGDRRCYVSDDRHRKTQQRNQHRIEHRAHRRTPQLDAENAAATVSGVADLDLTVELITHRFTPASRDVLLQWYPRTRLEMDLDQRSEKRSNFGGVKYVYPREVMTGMHRWFDTELGRRLPQARIL